MQNFQLTDRTNQRRKQLCRPVRSCNNAVLSKSLLEHIHSFQIYAKCNGSAWTNWTTTTDYSPASSISPFVHVIEHHVIGRLPAVPSQICCLLYACLPRSLQHVQGECGRIGQRQCVIDHESCRPAVVDVKSEAHLKPWVEHHPLNSEVTVATC